MLTRPRRDPHLDRRGGAVVLIGSAHTRRSFLRASHYARPRAGRFIRCWLVCWRRGSTTAPSASIASSGGVQTEINIVQDVQLGRAAARMETLGPCMVGAHRQELEMPRRSKIPDRAMDDRDLRWSSRRTFAGNIESDDRIPCDHEARQATKTTSHKSRSTRGPSSVRAHVGGMVCDVVHQASAALRLSDLRTGNGGARACRFHLMTSRRALAIVRKRPQDRPPIRLSQTARLSLESRCLHGVVFLAVVGFIPAARTVVSPAND